jgi:hypothetical protein
MVSSDNRSEKNAAFFVRVSLLLAHLVYIYIGPCTRVLITENNKESIYNFERKKCEDKKDKH